MLILGHRGAAGHAPENTLSSIRCALGMELDYIEFDVQRTRDDELVVFHDDRLARMAGLSGYIWDYSLDELRAVGIVGGKERIPTLDEVCATLHEGGGRPFIELKAQDIEMAALDIALEHFKPTEIIVGSFHHEAVLAVKRRDVSIRTAALFAGAPLDAGRIARETRCDFLGLGLDNVSGRVIDEAKAAGAGTLVWTVDDVRDLERVRALGADGVFSNYPDRIKAASTD